MNTFLKKLILYVTYFLILKILLFFIFRNIEREVFSNHSGEKIKVSMLGDSHLRHSLDDKFLSRNLSIEIKNFGRGGQAIFWSLIGARKLINQGSNFIFIEISNSNYTSNKNKIDYRRGLREYDKKYYLNFSEIIDFWKIDPYFIIKMFFKIRFPSTAITGRYDPINKNFENEIVIYEKTSFKPDYDNNEIINFIKKYNNINFLIFRAPKHPNYYSSIPKSNESFYIDRLAELNELKNCLTLDFGHKYSSDSLFLDRTHMSMSGANLFSKFFADTLKKINYFNGLSN